MTVRSKTKFYFTPYSKLEMVLHEASGSFLDNQTWMDQIHNPQKLRIAFCIGSDSNEERGVIHTTIVLVPAEDYKIVLSIKTSSCEDPMGPDWILKPTPQ